MPDSGALSAPERSDWNMPRGKRRIVLLVGVVVAGLSGGCGMQPADTPHGEDQAAPATPWVPDAPAARPTLREGRGEVAEPPLGPAGPAGSRLRLGQQAPDFEVTTMDGKRFKLSEQRGKVVLINFFATWCVPCNQEMPHLQKEVFEKIKGERFAMIALGREHDNAEVARFKERRRLGFPMAGDPGRAVFALYAEKSIPRCVVVGQDGRVIFESVSYVEKEFNQMVALLRARTASR
ncbi:MAG TPA: TlpA disulfide reductase family protein [Gemmataceae bacterium]|nr:TlpA disulfide reductase family protein [Gemmataceae bacterium]